MGVPEADDAADSVPQLVPLQPDPDKDQLTPLFCASFCTVAVKTCVLPVCTLALGGVTLTEIGAGAAAMVRVAISDLVLSATAIAVSITVAGFGTLTGAV